jgi:glucosyl-3-phosphoglycerate synthase
MDHEARKWFGASTFTASDFELADLIAAKRNSGTSISVVIPARNEAATVGAVVSQINESLVVTGLVDELVVLDSDSTDATASIAREAGAVVHAADAIDTGLDPAPGKGEALWKSLFVTSGDVLVFLDADLTEWGPHFVTGLLGPLLTTESTLLVKGFYDRLVEGVTGMGAEAMPQGGRVTELVARPLLNLFWPELAAVVQPLAGEWATRRSLMHSLPIPVGYGVEMATLIDTCRLHGLAAVAQVDLGRRRHVHQNVHDLGVMATEILATGLRRLPHGATEWASPSTATSPLAEMPPVAGLEQFDRTITGDWRRRDVPLLERPPAISIERYADRAAARSAD